MGHPTFSKEEIAARGKALYEQTLHGKIEANNIEANNLDKFIILTLKPEITRSTVMILPPPTERIRNIRTARFTECALDVDPAEPSARRQPEVSDDYRAGELPQ